MHEDSTAGIRAIRSWMRLKSAMAEFDRHLRAEFGVTGGQLAILRIIGEADTTLARLREGLVMHPATLGQLVERLAKLELVLVDQSPEDRRSRRVRLTERGRKLTRDAPVAGPVRLRSMTDRIRADRMAKAFDDAVELFGLDQWAQ